MGLCKTCRAGCQTVVPMPCQVEQPGDTFQVDNFPGDNYNKEESFVILESILLEKND